MSRCDLIAFPREVDTSSIKGLLDETRLLWESWGETQGAYVYMGDFNDLRNTETLGLSAVWENEPFKKIFSNKFVCEIFNCFGIDESFNNQLLGAGINEEDLYYFSTLGRVDLTHYKKGKNRKGKNVYLLQKHREEIISKLEQINASYIFWSGRCAKQLYDLIKLNTKIGETVEVYTCWYGLPSYKVPRPKEIRKINVDQILSPGDFYCKDRIKTEILII